MSSAETNVHLRQKRDRYYAEFYNADMDPPRKWKSLKTTDKGIALKKLRRWEERVLLGKWDPWSEADGDDGPQLLRDLIDHYLTLCEERYGESQQNVDDKRRTYDRLLKLLPSRARPADVTQDVVHDFLNRITGLDGGDPSPHTVYGYFSQIRVLCGWLVKNDHLSENPAATDDVRRRVPTPKTSRDSLRPSEINRIERAVWADIDRHPRRDHREYIVHALHFLACTGLRRSELKYLRLADCTLNEDGTGHIDVRSWEHPETEESFTVKTFDRRVPLYPRAAQALEAVAGDRLRDSDADPYESAFLAAQGGRINMAHFGDTLGDYAEQALPGRGVTPHWLRHTYISWSVNELGVTPHKVQQLVAHGSIETTMDYMHLSDGAVSGIIDDVRARHGLGSTGMSMQTREVLEYLFCQSIEEMREESEAEELNSVV